MSADRMIAHADALRVAVSIDVPRSLLPPAGPGQITVTASIPHTPPPAPTPRPAGATTWPPLTVYVSGQQLQSTDVTGISIRDGQVVWDDDDPNEPIRSLYRIAERGLALVVTDARIYVVDEALLNGEGGAATP